MSAPETRKPGWHPAISEQNKTNPAILPDEAAERKETATRVALAALAGIEARKLADGGWLVSRWGQYRELEDDLAFDAWLARVDGRR